MPIEHPNIDAFLYRPVIAGMWQQREATDGTYTFEDLLVAHEILDVKEANEIALNEYMEAKNQ